MDHNVNILQSGIQCPSPPTNFPGAADFPILSNLHINPVYHVFLSTTHNEITWEVIIGCFLWKADVSIKSLCNRHCNVPAVLTASLIVCIEVAKIRGGEADETLRKLSPNFIPQEQPMINIRNQVLYNCSHPLWVIGIHNSFLPTMIIASHRRALYSGAGISRRLTFQLNQAKLQCLRINLFPTLAERILY